MASEAWVFLNRKFDDPDEEVDPWQMTTNPWLFTVYNRLVERRRNRE